MTASTAFRPLRKVTKFIFHIPEVGSVDFLSRKQLAHIFPVVELALSRIPEDLRASVIDIINQSKSSASQKRASLLKKGLLRSTADELEILAEIGLSYHSTLCEVLIRSRR